MEIIQVLSNIDLDLPRAEPAERGRGIVFLCADVGSTEPVRGEIYIHFVLKIIWFLFFVQHDFSIYYLTKLHASQNKIKSYLS